jgi:hemerythrin-like domain-containing protein
MHYSETLEAQHRRCDADLLHTERLAHHGDWRTSAQAANDFVTHSEEHMRYEENTLFPRLVAALPMAAGPTAVMCSEHHQVRILCRELTAAVAAQDADGVGELVDTLLFLLQQHKTKEKTVLYPMADRALAPDPALATVVEVVG